MIRSAAGGHGDVVVVATVRHIEPYGDIREYAVKLFENHGRGIGDEGKDNGLLILLALKERRVWIEVGYGLEAVDHRRLRRRNQPRLHGAAVPQRPVRRRAALPAPRGSSAGSPKAETSTLSGVPRPRRAQAAGGPDSRYRSSSSSSSSSCC